MKVIKKEKLIQYMCLILLFTVILSPNAFTVQAESDTSQKIQSIQSEAFVLMDGDTGQVLLENNMREKIYPASITKVMTALIALEKGKLTDKITMSYDAVWSVGRETSHIALDENEQLTLENALYGLAISSANDAANGIAEFIGGSMPDFAKLMTAKAKELGAVNTNFTNAHGLHDRNHYTTAYDMAIIMSAAIKIPEFTKIFSAVSYDMPPTNRQPEARQFNRKNSLIEGFYKYDGIIAEKTGWTGDAGYTYVAAAKRNGRTLIAVVVKSPSETARWEDTTILFDYGFNEFTPLNYSAAEFGQEQYIIESTDGSKINIGLFPDGDFDCFVLKSLNKDDIEVKYVFSVDESDGKMNGQAVFALKSELSDFMFTELGEVNLLVYFNNSDGKSSPVSSIIAADNGQQEKSEKKSSIFSIIFRAISIILEIIGVLTVVWLILYVRKNIIIKKRKQQKLNYNNNAYNRYSK